MTAKAAQILSLERVFFKEVHVDISRAPILSDLGDGLVKDIMALSTTISLEKGVTLFNQGDAATHFYILVKGRVALGVGDPMHTTYIAHTEGEAIGWSSLTASRSYSASGICIESTTLLKFQNKEFKALLARDPDAELQFYRNLSQTLENRLLQSFELLSSLAIASGSKSFQKGKINDPFKLI